MKNEKLPSEASTRAKPKVPTITLEIETEPWKFGHFTQASLALNCSLPEAVAAFMNSVVAEEALCAWVDDFHHQEAEADEPTGALRKTSRSAGCIITEQCSERETEGLKRQGQLIVHFKSRDNHNQTDRIVSFRESAFIFARIERADHLPDGTHDPEARACRLENVARELPKPKADPRRGAR